MLWKSDHPDIEVPTDVTTWEWCFESNVFSALQETPRSQLGFYENAITKERLNYAEVKEKATSLSTTLIRDYGLENGDTVSLFATNTVWYPVALWATIRAGGRVNGASPAYNTDEMTYALRIAKTKFLFTLPGSIDIALAACRNVNISASHIFLLEGERDGFTSLQHLIQIGQNYIPTQPASVPKEMTNKEICGYLNFSSGTTGLPKAVMISHHNMIAQCHQLRQLQVVEPGEKYQILAVAPMFHITGLVRYVHFPVLMNGNSIMLPSFSMESMLQTIISYRIRELILVPPIIIRLVRDAAVDKYMPELGNVVKRWSSGSAPAAAEIIQLLHKKFPASGFRQGYGATESTACISCHAPSHYDYKYSATVGTLCANTVAKVIDMDDSNKLLGPNQVGEICAKGPQIVMGYLDNATATAETFDKDGYFHTGDVGYFDDEGLIHISDRIKEMIKVRGQQVAPAELEDTLHGHGSVEDCAVLGIPDAYSGEKPKAYVVLKQGVRPTVELGRELLRFVAERKVRYKRLLEIEFTDTVPKNPTGKLLRRMLRANDRNVERARGLCVRADEARAKL